MLLLVYWALNLPALGQEVAIIAWQYPVVSQRHFAIARTARGAGTTSARRRSSPQSNAPGLHRVQNVSVVAAGHQVLRDINLSIAAGSHVAIVGASGAGKSSLVGLLLGWHRAASGSVLVDGVELDESRLDQLRRTSRGWTRRCSSGIAPLAENLRYGSPETCSIESAIDAAELPRVIERLPNGLDTPLGEGGGLVSGGEGQRVRLGRALLRPDVRLAILDEPFRGLDFEQRHKLLARARETWRDATLLAISHDIAEAMSFERVLVIEDGRIVEDGDPRELAAIPNRASMPCSKPKAPSAKSSGTARSGATCVSIMANSLPDSWLWPASRLGEALCLLTVGPSVANPQSPIPELTSAIGSNPPRSAMGFEAQPAETTYSDFERDMRSHGPGFDARPHRRWSGVSSDSSRLDDCSRPICKKIRVDPAIDPLRALRQHRSARPARNSRIHCDRAQIPPAKQARARDAILRERLSSKRIRGIWLLRLPPGANFREQLRHATHPPPPARARRRPRVQYVLWILAWFVVGSNVLRGGTDRGWLIPWALLLLTLVPLRVLITRLQGWVAIGAGALLKQRLFFGSLRLEPDSIRHQGAGQLLGRVLESEAVEALALSGGFLAFVALIEIIAAIFVLAAGAGGLLQSALLFVWLVVAAAIAWRYFQRNRDWTDVRLAMTHDLVESMAGHRTRLAQLPADRWHDGEDRGARGIFEELPSRWIDRQPG